MKKVTIGIFNFLIFLMVVLLSSVTVSAQVHTYVSPSLNNNKNYVYTRTYQDAGAAATGAATAASDVIEQVTYFDGLGRPEQQVAIHATPDYGDLVTPIGYDGFGRQDKEWLPYPAIGAPGSYRSDEEEVMQNVNNYYRDRFPEDMSATPSLQNAFSEKEFEASPLNRVLKQAAPGQDWALGSGHEIKMEYDTNTQGDGVRLFEVNLDAEYIPTLTGGSAFYDPGQLYKNITKDENWTSGKNHTTEEFTDKQGRVVLKRSYADVDGQNEVRHDTYYVYDDYGNLSYVLPPKVTTSNGISALELADLCFQYRYDSRNRLIEKKLPGKGEEYIVYNKLDKPVMTQDANLKEQSKWLFTKYDAHGRVTYTGLHDGDSRSYLQGRADDTSSYEQFESRDVEHTYGGAKVYYSKASIPNGVSEIYTVNYYDTYLPPAGQAQITVPLTTVYGDDITDRTQGLPTVTRTRVLETDQWITTVMGYDEKGRVIWTRSINPYLGTDDITQNLLDFAGKVLETTTLHTKVGQPSPITTIDSYSYDHMGRVSRHTQKINGQPTELIAANTYDPTGQLERKKVGGAASGNGLQSVDYTYNIRGWLKSINDPQNLKSDLFAFGINYNNKQMGANNDLLFNGNISETYWKTINDSPGGITRGYAYTYDDLNRIKNANYGIKTTSAFNLSSGYDMGVGSYDKNGNIISLTRQDSQGGLLDQLSYFYAGADNQLTVVKDGSGNSEGFNDGNPDMSHDYSYDPNGNLEKDLNKGITGITYNHLNLPKSIQITQNEGAGTGTISYIYDATGNKLEKTTPGKVTHYSGNFIYENNQLKFFQTEEGYVEPKNENNYSLGFDYIYNYTDHLDNIRLSYKSQRNYVIRSDFEDDMAGWGNKGWHVNREIVGGRMKTSIIDAYAGTAYPLNQISAVPGEKYTISLELDKATTESSLRFYIEERDENNTHLSYNMLNTNLPSGIHNYEYTVKEGSFLILRIDKDNTNTDKTTHFYIDNVSMNQVIYDYVIDSDFQNDMNGWGNKGWHVNRQIVGGRMKTSVIDAYAGTAYPLSEISAVPGEKYTISLELDKATTESALRFYIEERDENNAHLSYNMLSTNLPSGAHNYEYTVNEGSFLILRIDKDNTNTDKTTYFYLDNVSMIRGERDGDLEVLTKRDYYPFGMLHSGYNNNIVGVENNYQTYNGKELEKSLGLNTLDFGARNYDAALGRWMNIDPLAEKFVETSPYVYAKNNPVFFVDHNGEEPVPGPFTGAGWRQSNGTIVVHRITAGQRYALNVYYATTVTFGGGVGTAFGVYDSAKIITNPSETNLTRASVATQLALDGASSFMLTDAAAKGFGDPYTTASGKVVDNPKNIKNLAKGVKGGLGAIGIAAALTSDSSPTRNELISKWTFQFADSFIKGGNINIAQEGLFNVYDNNATVEGSESRLNAIHAGINIFLAGTDFDLDTDQGQADAAKYITNNAKYVAALTRYIYNYYNNKEEKL